MVYISYTRVLSLKNEIFNFNFNILKLSLFQKYISMDSYIVFIFYTLTFIKLLTLI